MHAQRLSAVFQCPRPVKRKTQCGEKPRMAWSLSERIPIPSVSAAYAQMTPTCVSPTGGRVAARTAFFDVLTPRTVGRWQQRRAHLVHTSARCHQRAGADPRARERCRVLRLPSHPPRPLAPPLLRLSAGDSRKHTRRLQEPPTPVSHGHAKGPAHTGHARAAHSSDGSTWVQYAQMDACVFTSSSLSVAELSVSSARAARAPSPAANGAPVSRVCAKPHGWRRSCGLQQLPVARRYGGHGLQARAASSFHRGHFRERGRYPLLALPSRRTRQIW